MKNKLVFIMLFLIFSVSIFAENKAKYQEIRIKFNQTNLTVKQALDELNNLPEVDVVYNGSEPFLNIQITLPVTLISVEKALDIIQEQAPIEILFNKNHIIVKGKKLKESYLLRGIIKDAKTRESLIAANVLIRGTSKGTVADINGEFLIKLAPGSYELEIRYIGYKNKRININLYNDKSLQIFLDEEKQKIGEVKVIGTFNDLQDLKIGRPIERIESKTINQLNTNVVNDALHGRINGIWTTKTSGAPGDHNKIRIRGISSIFGSADPLYIVDGVIVPIVNLKTLGIADLNTHDIESITVLKDASSTALYGYLGGNGVILIETKKGGGETSFDFNVKSGIQWFTKRYPLMNSEDFLSTHRISDSIFNTRFYRYDSRFPGDPPILQKFPDYIDTLGNRIGSDDFQDEIFQIGAINEYQLSGQGNLLDIDYYLSGDYYTHKGIVVNSEYDKYSFTANLSKIIGEKLSFRLLYKGSRQENKNNLNNYLGNPVIYKGINYEPSFRYTSPDLLILPWRQYYGEKLQNKLTIDESNTVNRLTDNKYTPDMLFNEQFKTKTEGSNTVNLQGMYKVTNNLSFHAALSMSFKHMLYKSYLPLGMKWNEQNEKFLSSDEHISIINQQYDLRYKKLINNHNINGFVRFRNYKDNAYWEIDSLKNVKLEGIRLEDGIYLQGSQALFGEYGSVIRTIHSGTFNINYCYRDKYSVSTFLNLDRLEEGYYLNNNGLFYSVAIDYNLSKEEILRIPKWINAFHLYANMGHVGNYPLNSLSNDLFAVREYASQGQPVDAVIATNLANHYLKHEEITEYNMGTKIALWQDKIILSGDYYLKYYSDLLLRRTIPYYYIGGIFYQNIGKMENKGIELSLETIPVERSNFFWNTKFGFASNKQVITKLSDGEPIDFYSTDFLFPDFHIKENETLGTINGYSYQGIWDDRIHSFEANGYHKYYRLYSFSKYNVFAYLNSDTSTNKFDEKDKIIIGKSVPDFTCNWINSITYKNFTFEMLWYGVFGTSKYNAARACTYIAGTNSEVRELVIDSVYSITNSFMYKSSYFIEDASFIRLKTLSFRYKQAQKIAGKVGIEYAVSFENLVTITKYKGYDPEATIYTLNNFSDNAIDKGAYPNPRGVYVSINLSF